MKYPPGRLVLLFGLSISITVHSLHAENWPQWRGPSGNSVSRETGLPVVWTYETGVVWKTALPEWGTSTPAIWDNAIFVTSHRDDALLLLRINKQSGAIEWTQQVGSGTAVREGPKRERQKFHQLHNLASPSPVTDGKLVVVHFGNGELAAYDFAGQLQWRRNLQNELGTYTIWWGHANSPVLFQGLVISVCMQDPLDGIADSPAPSYLIAHDLESGKEKWKSMRMTGATAEQGDAYTTPVFAEVGGQTQLIVMGGNQLDAYDPKTGKQLWYLPGLVGGRTVTGPTIGEGLVYVTQGQKGPLQAIKLGGAGKIPAAAIAWKYDQGSPDTCCPVVWKHLLFTIGDDGIARCFDAYDGRLKWKERLKGGYKASPLAVDGRIYFLNTTGLCTVVAAGERFERLAENQLDDSTIASPAVSDVRLFIRGQKMLYCLGRIR